MAGIHQAAGGQLIHEQDVAVTPGGVLRQYPFVQSGAVAVLGAVFVQRLAVQLRAEEILLRDQQGVAQRVGQIFHPLQIVRPVIQRNVADVAGFYGRLRLKYAGRGRTRLDTAGQQDENQQNGCKSDSSIHGILLIRIACMGRMQAVRTDDSYRPKAPRFRLPVI